MKWTLFIILTIIGGILSNCDDADDIPPYVTFNFIVIDSLGNDMFFESNSAYSANDVIFGLNQDSQVIDPSWFVIVDSSHFQLDHFRLGANESYEFYFQFLQNRIDTISIIESDNPDYSTPSIEFDIYFNSKIICRECNEQNIYKISIYE
ncbi:MAG: hypothetical protein P1P82_09735 [Bacteroidales bacterium]|nr:hypothetical protein [Bacteroidales bacterium]MDT8431224.1 hypothetical protein [Bacteroidales bacterium]